MKKITEKAYAKINLLLDILSKRPDGFHDLRMIMQTIELHDLVTVERGTGDGVVLTCSDPTLPTGENNLAVQAARAFLSATGVPCDGISIHIEKCIPSQAGMAGGSSDAAAVLRALWALYDEPCHKKELERIGETVGSDVPYCVRGGTVLAEGRGEILTNLPAMNPCSVVVCKPDFDISTPELFGRVRVARILHHPDTVNMIKCIEEQGLSRICTCVENVFETFLAEEQKTKIEDIKKELLTAGALCAQMTGSGPAVFGLFDDCKSAERGASKLKKLYSQVFLTNMV